MANGTNVPNGELATLKTYLLATFGIIGIGILAILLVAIFAPGQSSDVIGHVVDLVGPAVATMLILLKLHDHGKHLFSHGQNITEMRDEMRSQNPPPPPPPPTPSKP